jgi:hypothetical protein
VGPAIAQIGSAANGQPVYIPNSTLPSSGFVYQASIIGQVTMNDGTDSGGTSGPLPNPTFSGTVASPITLPPTTETNAPVSIWVTYFGPDLTLLPSTPVGDDPWLVAVGSGTTWTNYYDINGTDTPGPSGSAYSGLFAIPATDTSPYTAVTIGPRVLKVYVLPASVTTPAAFTSCVSNPTATNPIYATSTLNVTLVPGTQTINLALPHYSP